MRSVEAKRVSPRALLSVGALILAGIAVVLVFAFTGSSGPEPLCPPHDSPGDYETLASCL